MSHQPSQPLRVPQRHVVWNVIPDKSFEHRVFKDSQGPFGPDRLDRLVAESFVLRGVADQVDGAIGAIEGIVIEVAMLEPSVRDDHIAPIDQLDV